MAGGKMLATVKAERRFGCEGMRLWRLTGLSLWRTPAWFRRIVDSDYSGNFDADWFDHYSKDGDTLVVEPYGLNDAGLHDLLAFADRYSLSVSISATSQHYPTRTLAVFLTPKRDNT